MKSSVAHERLVYSTKKIPVLVSIFFVRQLLCFNSVPCSMQSSYQCQKSKKVEVDKSPLQQVGGEDEEVDVTVAV